MSAKFSSAAVLSLVAIAGCLFGSTAQAATTWNFGNASNCTQVAGTGSVSSSGQTGTYGNSWTCNGTTPQVTATAWSTSGSNSSFGTAWLPIWSGSGFGVVNSAGDDSHSLDNSGWTDLILFDFGNYAVDLNSVTIGWSSNDSDISLLRYTGDTAPSLAGKTVAENTTTGLLKNGWELVGNYADLGVGSAKDVNVSNAKSSWWIISAYNGAYTTTTGDNLADALSDKVKILAIAGDATLKTPPPTTDVPEPGSLALMGIAMAGFVATRRRKQKAA